LPLVRHLDELLIEVSDPARSDLQLSALFAKYFNSSGFWGLATPRWPPMFRSPGGSDMLKRSLFVATAASFAVTLPVLWFVLDADLHLKKANATTSTVLSKTVLSKAVAPEPFKVTHAANQMTTRLLTLDQAQHLAFWTVVLKNKKQACDVVVRTMYQGGTESGVDNWSIGCQDGNKYSIRINQDAEESVCTRNAFVRSAE
jgi:hypothetical protein